MSKAKQLMELATQDIIAEFARKKNIGITEAMNIFYGSEFCKKLYDESTGLYLEGTKYLYGYTDFQKAKLKTASLFKTKYKDLTAYSNYDMNLSSKIRR